MSFKQIYKRWLIDCEPQATADGKFAAHVTLSKSTGRDAVEGTLTPNLPAFDERRPAADAALAAAKKWIDNED